MNEFSLDNKAFIIIYGLGPKGIEVYNNLKKSGYRIRCFLDNNAPNLINKTPDAKPIYCLDTDLKAEYLEDIVIITLQNGLHHPDIARSLFERGYKKIVFLPVDMQGYQYTAKKMFTIYNNLLEGKCRLEGIPYYDEMVREYSHKILSEDADGVVINLPCELIYSELDQCNGIKYKEATLFKYDTLIYAGELNVSLFKYFGKSTGETLYFDDITAKQTYKNIEDRYKLYCLFERHFSEGIDFFSNSAPIVRYNDKGYVNLSDGHHRCSYLVHKGLKKIPVRIKWAEYNALFNEDKIMELYSELSKITYLSTPVEYVNMPAQGDEYLRYFARTLESTLAEGVNSVVCIGTHSNYYARLCYRKGIKNIQAYARHSEVESNLQQKINRIFCNNAIWIANEVCDHLSIQSDMVIISLEDLVNCEVYTTVKVAHLINRYVGRRIILISDLETQKEILKLIKNYTLNNVDSIRYQDKLIYFAQINISL